ncbi:MAG: acyl-CoA thioesterase [Rhodocyclaceae bacterium]|nr:acyl-CoA thioesterase [Rhodocyclaceae bacterium]
MARVKIDLPDTFFFQTDILLYASHMNRMNHLDNALLLSVVSEARMRFFAQLGYDEQDMDGIGVIVADAALQYRSEAHHGETVRVSMTATDFWERGCDLVWALDEAESGRRVAHGKTGIVFFDYARNAAAGVPPGFSRHFGA